MKVVRIHEFGGPEVLALEEAPQPEPGPAEVLGGVLGFRTESSWWCGALGRSEPTRRCRSIVEEARDGPKCRNAAKSTGENLGHPLVRIHAASVTPVDCKMRSGAFPMPSADAVHLGRDIAGTVERCGRDVRDFAPGEQVYAMLPRDRSGYAEYVTVPAALCAPKPRNLDATQAAAVPLAAITAYQGLFDHGSLTAGQYVLIHGGAGGVGHFAVQLAHAAGARVSTTVSAQDREFARQLGAEQVVDYKNERFEDKVKDVDLVFDLVAGETQERSWNVLREGGTIISTLARPSEENAKQRHARAESYVAQPNAEELRKIAAWIEEGKVHPVVDSALPLSAVAEAQEKLETKHVRGKVVLQMVGLH